MTLPATDIVMKASAGGVLIHPDSAPDPFSFTDQTNVAISDAIESDPITITGIDSFDTALITTDIGTYSINGGTPTSLPGAGSLGDLIRAQHTSSSTNSDPTDQLITIGGVSDTFTSTTESGVPVGSPIFTTAFDYATECTQRGVLGGPSCESVENDGLQWNWGADIIGGHPTEAVVAAKNPLSPGALGARFWVDDGVNQQSGNLKLVYPGGPYKEMWIRWYQRYQAGFQWASGVSGTDPSYDKTLYINTNGPLAILPQPARADGEDTWRIGIQAGGGSNQAKANPAISWTDVFGATSDGVHHRFEMHVKIDTDSTDGVGQFWIDEQLVIDVTGIDFSAGNATSRQGVAWMEFHANQNSPNNGGARYVDYDDIEIWATTPPNVDGAGNPWIGPLNGDAGSSMPVDIIFTESAEDGNFSSRGWYDNTAQTLSNDGAFVGSTQSIDWTWALSATKPPNGAAMRYGFADTDNIYISYYVKYTSPWQGSGQGSYHPHLFHFLTNKDSAFAGLDSNELTLYVESSSATEDIITPRVGTQRQDQHPGATIYNSASTISPDTWHKVEAFFKMNTLTGTVGNTDGIARYWLDGVLLIDETTALLRTGAANTDMLINQLILAPYIGDGSPISQAMFVDQIKLGTEQ